MQGVGDSELTRRLSQIQEQNNLWSRARENKRAHPLTAVAHHLERKRAARFNELAPTLHRVATLFRGHSANIGGDARQNSDI